MNKHLSLLLALLLPAAFLFSQEIQSIAIGTMLPAQDVKLKDVSGKETSLAEVRGENGLLVMFSCNTCPFVVKNQQRTREICEYAEANGFGVIIINSNVGARDSDDSFEAMKKYATDQQYKWLYVMDDGSKVADAFGAARTPEVFVFNKQNQLVYKGAIDDNPGNAAAVKKQHLKNALDQTSKGAEVTIKESRSVGCGIKRVS